MDGIFILFYFIFVWFHGLEEGVLFLLQPWVSVGIKKDFGTKWTTCYNYFIPSDVFSSSNAKDPFCTLGFD